MRTIMAQIAYAVQGSGGTIPATWNVGEIISTTGTFAGAVSIQQAVASDEPIRADQGWQIVASYVLSGASSQDIPLSSDFREFKLLLRGMTVGTASASLTALLSNDGGGTFHPNSYAEAISGLLTDGTTYGPVAGKSLSNISLSPSLNANSSGWNLDLVIYPGDTGTRCALFGKGFGLTSGSQYARVEFGATWDSTTGAQNYLRLGTTSGLLSGSVILLGLR
jgi:hypothetical protein